MVDSFINGPTTPCSQTQKPVVCFIISVCSNGIHVDRKALVIMQLSKCHSFYCMCYLLYHYLYVYLQSVHFTHFTMIWRGRSKEQRHTTSTHQTFLLLLFLWQMSTKLSSADSCINKLNIGWKMMHEVKQNNSFEKNEECFNLDHLFLAVHYESNCLSKPGAYNYP